MKRFSVLIAFCIAFAWSFAAAAGPRGPLEGEPKRSYGAVDVVMYQTTAALGYGFDYVYTILERCRVAGLKGDKLMAAPQLCDVAGETYRVKEALADEDTLPGWGKLDKRGPMWEAACASGYIQAGADIVILAHPAAISSVRALINNL